MIEDILYVWGCACVRVCTPFVTGTCGGHKRVGDPLEMELQVVVSHHMSAGNGIGVLWKSSKGP